MPPGMLTLAITLSECVTSFLVACLCAQVIFCLYTIFSQPQLVLRG